MSTANNPNNKVPEAAAKEFLPSPQTAEEKAFAAENPNQAAILGLRRAIYHINQKGTFVTTAEQAYHCLMQAEMHYEGNAEVLLEIFYQQISQLSFLDRLAEAEAKALEALKLYYDAKAEGNELQILYLNRSVPEGITEILNFAYNRDNFAYTKNAAEFIAQEFPTVRENSLWQKLCQIVRPFVKTATSGHSGTGTASTDVSAPAPGTDVVTPASDKSNQVVVEEIRNKIYKLAQTGGESALTSGAVLDYLQKALSEHKNNSALTLEILYQQLCHLGYAHNTPEAEVVAVKTLKHYYTAQANGEDLKIFLSTRSVPEDVVSALQSTYLRTKTHYSNNAARFVAQAFPAVKEKVLWDKLCKVVAPNQGDERTRNAGAAVQAPPTDSAPARPGEEKSAERG